MVRWPRFVVHLIWHAQHSFMASADQCGLGSRPHLSCHSHGVSSSTRCHLVKTVMYPVPLQRAHHHHIQDARIDTQGRMASLVNGVCAIYTHLLDQRCEVLWSRRWKCYLPTPSVGTPLSGKEDGASYQAVGTIWQSHCIQQLQGALACRPPCPQQGRDTWYSVSLQRLCRLCPSWFAGLQVDSLPGHLCCQGTSTHGLTTFTPRRQQSSTPRELRWCEFLMFRRKFNIYSAAIWVLPSRHLECCEMAQVDKTYVSKGTSQGQC